MGEWPKTLAPLPGEQQAVYDDFMKRWHEILPQRYGAIERFNHSFAVNCSRAGFTRTIEVGAGLGEHMRYERLSPAQERDYCAVELRENMAERIRARYPQIQVITGDCQDRLPFADGHFDRYLAIHVLEHLPNLPACVREAWRLLDRRHGQLLVVIPCEGGGRTRAPAACPLNGYLNAPTTCHMAHSSRASISIARERSSPSSTLTSCSSVVASFHSRSCRGHRRTCA